MQEETNQCFSLASLFPSIPLSLTLSKINEKCFGMRIKRNVPCEIVLVRITLFNLVAKYTETAGVFHKGVAVVG